jgi:hypothetical protein
LLGLARLKGTNSTQPETAEDGELLGYGPRNQLCFWHVITLVDKDLRGNLPIELYAHGPSGA